MSKNLIISLIALLFIISSCGGTADSVKRGLTGQKQTAADEFLVQKKDPLILPPNFDDLPSPSERNEEKQEVSIFEKKLEKSTTQSSSSSTSSTEESILQQIQNK